MELLQKEEWKSPKSVYSTRMTLTTSSNNRTKLHGESECVEGTGEHDISKTMSTASERQESVETHRESGKVCVFVESSPPLTRDLSL